MSDESDSKLATWGIIATLLYVILLLGGLPVLYYLRWLKLEPLALSEIGDFLAGAFGPLAIFWIVLGFFQQGKELRLQVRELGLSVEQQKELVGVTRETLEHEREQNLLREVGRRKSIQPDFSVIIRPSLQSDVSDGIFEHRLAITNAGAAASRVSLDFESTPYRIQKTSKPFWQSGETVFIEVRFKQKGLPDPNEMTISYLDGDGVQSTKSYFIGPSEESSQTIIVSEIKEITRD